MRLGVVKIFSLQFASIISKMAELQGVSKICLFTDRFELHWIKSVSVLFIKRWQKTINIAQNRRS